MSARRGAGAYRSGTALAAALGVSLLLACHGTFKPVTAVVGGGGTTTDSTALVQMSLSPLAVTLAPSGTVQYAVSGRLGDGTVVAPTVSYVTSGGTITADGLFTAGSTAGTELVIATQAGGPTGSPPCCTDTSVVTVAAATMARRALARRAP
jgi:hypothetical protein